MEKQERINLEKQNKIDDKNSSYQDSGKELVV